MKLTKESRYAVRAIFELASSTTGAPLPVSAIAAAQKIPHAFLEGIMRKLSMAHIVKSVRGGSGGYLLTRPASQISVGQVVQTVLGLSRSEKQISCEFNTDCPLKGDCAFELLWKDVQGAAMAVMAKTDFQKLVNGYEGIQFELVEMK